MKRSHLGRTSAASGDQHMADIKLGPARTRRIEQIERPRPRHEGQDRVFLAPFDVPVNGQGWFVEHVRQGSDKIRYNHVP